MTKQVERLLAAHIEEERREKVKPLEERHAAEVAGSPTWWDTLRLLQVERARVQGMEVALSFIEGVHFAQESAIA